MASPAEPAPFDSPTTQSKERWLLRTCNFVGAQQDRENSPEQEYNPPFPDGKQMTSTHAGSGAPAVELCALKPYSHETAADSYLEDTPHVHGSLLIAGSAGNQVDIRSGARPVATRVNSELDLAASGNGKHARTCA